MITVALVTEDYYDLRAGAKVAVLAFERTGCHCLRSDGTIRTLPARIIKVLYVAPIGSKRWTPGILGRGRPRST